MHIFSDHYTWNLILFNTSQHRAAFSDGEIFYGAALLKTRLLRLNARSTNKFSRSFFEIYFFCTFSIIIEFSSCRLSGGKKVPECVGIEVVFFTKAEQK
jgi:hypothetical protein